MELLEPIIQDQKQIWEQNGWQADIQEGIQKTGFLVQLTFYVVLNIVIMA